MFMEMMVVYRYLVGRNTPIPPGLNLPTVSIIQPAHGALGYYCYCYDLKETRLSILLLLSGHLFLLNGWLLLLVFHFIPLLLQLNWEKIRQHFNISGCYWKSICFSISASMLLPAKSDNSPSFFPTIVYSRKIVSIFLQISAFHLPEADCFIFTLSVDWCCHHTTRSGTKHVIYVEENDNISFTYTKTNTKT